MLSDGVSIITLPSANSENLSLILFQEYSLNTINSLLSSNDNYISFSIKTKGLNKSTTTTLERKIGSEFFIDETTTIEEFITEILELVLPILYDPVNDFQVLNIEVLKGSLNYIHSNPVCCFIFAKNNTKLSFITN